MTGTSLAHVPELTGYHLPYLLAAEAGELTYDKTRHPIHLVPNNALACLWAGLLEDGDGGMVLTDEGARRLAEWKTSPAGRAWYSDDNGEQPAAGPGRAAPGTTDDPGRQLDLFEAVTGR